MDGVEVGAAVFVDLQVFVAAGFQCVFDEPALADAVEGADGEFVQGDAGVFDAAVEVDEAVQAAFAHGGEDEVAVDGVGFARAVKLCAEAGSEGVVVIQQGLIRQVGVGDGFEAVAQGAQAVAHAVLHFGGGFAGEGGGDDVARGGSGLKQQAQDDAGERPGFAGAGRGFDEGAATQGQGEGRRGVHRGGMIALPVSHDWRRHYASFAAGRSGGFARERGVRARSGLARFSPLFGAVARWIVLRRQRRSVPQRVYRAGGNGNGWARPAPVFAVRLSGRRSRSPPPAGFWPPHRRLRGFF